MPLRYYPLSRVITNRYTRGDEFVKEDGTPYTGRYYTTYTGASFTGVNPVVGENIPLFRALQRNERHGETPTVGGRRTLADTRFGGVGTSDLFTAQEEPATTLNQLVPYFPDPTESDYRRGYFTRYFAKNVSGPGYIIEISKQDWSRIQNGEVEDNVLGYEIADMLWQLTGPLNDRRISQYQIQGGVFDTNKRVTEGEERTFRGLIAFIGGDYTKFARITP
jgi:hypothetical protein